MWDKDDWLAFILIAAIFVWALIITFGILSSGAINPLEPTKRIPAPAPPNVLETLISQLT